MHKRFAAMLAAVFIFNIGDMFHFDMNAQPLDSQKMEFTQMALKRFTSVTLVALVDHKVLFQFARLTKYFIAYFTCIEMLSGVSVMENKYI